MLAFELQAVMLTVILCHSRISGLSKLCLQFLFFRRYNEWSIFICLLRQIYKLFRVSSEQLINMKSLFFWCIFLCAFLVAFSIKPHRSCLKSYKGKLCLKLSVKSFGHCMSNKVQVVESNKELCVVGSSACAWKPRVCSGFNHLKQQ